MLGNYKVVDLTQPIHTNMPVFPMVLKTHLGVYLGHKDTLRPGNISSQTNILVMSDHAGTHVDAPLHFNPEGTGIDQMPVEAMVGNAVLLDYSAKKTGESVSTEEVKAGLAKIGVDQADLKFVLFRTGADRLYGSDDYWGRYLEIKADLVEWMLDQGILVFGVDASTVDHAKDRATHMLMRKRLCYHMENLTNFDKLPVDRPFIFICAPLLMKNSSASPFRALALVPPK